MDLITRKQSLSATQGVVTSNHPVASSVGISILASGGNAFDSAVGTAFALSVVEPMMVGPFGAGFTNFFRPNKGFSTIDGYGSAPGEAYETMYKPISNDLNSQKSFNILTLIITDKDLTDEEWEYYDSQAKGFEKDFTWATDNKANVNLGNLKDSIR